MNCETFVAPQLPCPGTFGVPFGAMLTEKRHKTHYVVRALLRVPSTGTEVTQEEPHYPLTYDPALMRATKTHLAATGIEVVDIELARIMSGDNPRDYLRFLEAGAALPATS